MSNLYVPSTTFNNISRNKMLVLIPGVRYDMPLNQSQGHREEHRV